MGKRIGVLIGRFQGYHYYHHEHVRRAALENDLLVIIVGSRNQRVSIKNPWTAEERIEMIEANIKDDPELNSTRIVLRVSNDHPNNNVWANWTRHIVNQFVNAEDTVTLYGCNKDASSFYLSLFPEWDQNLTELTGKYSATDLRRDWLMAGQSAAGVMNNLWVPTATAEWLKTRQFNLNLHNEWKYYLDEQIKFSGYPFPETLNFNCGDAVVVCHDRVLMIRRKNNPGKGCLALPGGFKNRNETFHQAAVRELYEETQLEVPLRHLLGCQVDQQLFDNPARSIGIPRSTLAVMFDISKYYMDEELPKTRASDDAAGIEWVNAYDLIFATDVFDDHAAIVTTLLN